MNITHEEKYSDVGMSVLYTVTLRLFRSYYFVAEGIAENTPISTLLSELKVTVIRPSETSIPDL